MDSKPRKISFKVYYTKHNKIPLKLYYQEEDPIDAEHFIVFCFENKDKPQLLIAANDTLTLTSKNKGFKKLLVKVKEFEPTPHNQNCLGYIYPTSIQEL